MIKIHTNSIPGKSLNRLFLKYVNKIIEMSKILSKFPKVTNSLTHSFSYEIILLKINLLLLKMNERNLIKLM